MKWKCLRSKHKYIHLNCALWCNTVINSRRIYTEQRELIYTVGLHTKSCTLIFNFGRNTRLMTWLLQFIDDYDVTKEVSWAGWIDRRKANSLAFAWTRLFFLLSRTFRSYKMASGDRSRRLVAVLSRNYGHIVGEISCPRLRGFMRAR